MKHAPSPLASALVALVALAAGCRADPPGSPGQSEAPAAQSPSPDAALPGSLPPGDAISVDTGDGPSATPFAGLPSPLSDSRAGAEGCVVYPGLAVRVAPRPEGGEAIAAGPPDPGPDPCAAAQPLPGGPAEFFAGVADGLVLIDAGTGPDGRRLRVLDGATGRVLLDEPYALPVEWGGGRLHFGAAPVRAGAAEAPLVASLCPEAPAWQARGLGVGLSRRMQFDPAAREAAPTPILACVPLQ